MKTKTSFLKSALFTLAVTLGLSAPVAANSLDAPDELNCRAGRDMVYTSWSDVNGAMEYAVEVTGEYDLDGDSQTDRTHDFHFGTTDPRLDLFQSDLEASFYDDTSQKVVVKKAKSAKVRVKALRGYRLTKGGAHENDQQNAPRSQNAEASNMCAVTLSGCQLLRGC